MRFLDRFRKGRGKTEVEPVVEAEPAVPAASDETESEISEPSVQIEPEEVTVSDLEPVKKKEGLFARLKKGLTKTRENITEKVEQLIKTSRRLDEDFFEELEAILIQADVGVNTTLELVDSLRQGVKEQRLTEVEDVKGLIKEEIAAIMTTDRDNSLCLAAEPPTIIMVVGVNGVGKTTTIAKLAYRFKQEGSRTIIAAADTFRAAAIDQLQIWADRVGVEVIKHQEGADPGAVVFDAVNAARSRQADFLIIDTAGRLHTKSNLMDEIAKVKRVIQREYPDGPHEVLLVLDATTGQNAISQAKEFHQATGVTGIALTKLDGTAKGGIVIAITKELDIPVKLIGIGETLEDLREFDAAEYVEALFA